jgi:hypothetical protein
MDLLASPETNSSSERKNPGGWGEIAWLFSGFIMPLGSFSFYRKAARRSVGMAILFFLIFTLSISTISSIATSEKLNSFGSEIRKPFQNGTMPEIVIRDGIAEVTGHQPAVILDDSSTPGQRTIIVVDTTGTYNEIDRSSYDQGLLLTRTELQILNNTGRYQTLPLSELNSTFNKNPIVINGETASNAWAVLSIIIVIVFFIALVVWNTIVRLMFLATSALILWGLISLIRPKTDYGPIIISGIYAIVPTVYIHFLFGRITLSFPFLQTLLLIPLWVIALFASLSTNDFFNKERPLRLWRSLLGIPMLLIFIIILLIEFQYSGYISVGVAIVTAIVLAGIGIYFRVQRPSEPINPPIPPTA